MKAFLILSSGKSNVNFYREDFLMRKKDEDIVISANGGYTIAASMGIKPDFLIGDMDSVERIDKNNNLKLMRYPRDKDYSDFELSLQYAKNFNPEIIIVYGALGGRDDHSFINLVLLAYLEIPSVFIENDVMVYNIKNSVVLHNESGRLCSLVALSAGCRVDSMEGFKYEIKDEELKPSSRGLSNIINKDRAVIRANGGPLLFFLNKHLYIL